MPLPTVSPAERPLGHTAKFFLVLSAAAHIALCYVFSIGAIIALLVLFAGEFIAMLALARFGMAGFLIDVMKRHGSLSGIFLRSFWLGKGTEYRITLRPSDAPRLFELLDPLAGRLGVDAPNEVSIEMNCGAWVALHGLRRGAGRTVLGVGYDLLAGLEEHEVEAVLAHEMAHAKLVQRGVKTWLNRGLARMVRAAGELADVVQAYRNANKRFELAESLLRIAHHLTARAAELVARYSRQDEFEADSGAAGLCGAASLRSALLSLESMQKILARLPWTERVAQLERQAGFSDWIVQELASARSATTVPLGPEARDPYSTHPTLHDRLAALPATTSIPPSPAPGIRLLAEPDRVAERLMAEILRVVTLQEEKDTRSLAKVARRAQRGAEVRWLQLPAIGAITAAVIVGLNLFVDRTVAWWALPADVAMLAAGVWLWRIGRYKDRRTLPVPGYAVMKKVQFAGLPADIAARESQFESELNENLRSDPHRGRQRRFLIEDAYGALARCDYLRAHVATRLLLERNAKDVEAALGHMVAAAGLHQPQSVSSLLAFLQKKTGIATPATTWGVAWAFVLIGDWNHAEALLWQIHQRDRSNPTFLMLLALAQSRRGKLQSAIAHAETALTHCPASIEDGKQLARLLLDGGRLREADARLLPLAAQEKEDPEIIVLMVRLRLLQHDFESAETWAGSLRETTAGASWLIELGEAFEERRRDARAAGLFVEALAQGYFPQAHVGLARIASRQEHKDEAKQQLLAALNMEKPVAVGATGPLPLFHSILQQIMVLDERRENCRAWIAKFASQASQTTPDALVNCSVMVFAQSRAAAEAHLDLVLSAMRPTSSLHPSSTLFWCDASSDQQPTRPVYPGVQCVL